MYLYNNLWIDIEQKKGKVILDGSDRIVSMIYIEKDIIASSTYYFITGKPVSKDMEHIKERIADFTSFKEEVEINEIICNKIQRIWKLWYKITNKIVQVKNSYYWLIYDGIKNIISMNPYDHLESEQSRIGKSEILLLITSNAHVNMVYWIQW